VRILHMTTEFPPVVFGGLGTAVGGLVHALAAGGDTVGVLLVGGGLAATGYGMPTTGAANGHTGPGHPDVEFFQVPWNGPLTAAARIAKSWRADLVHLHTAWIWPFAETVADAGIPVVYTAHSVDRAEYELGMEPGHILEHADDQGQAVRRVDRLIGRSRAVLPSAHCPDDDGEERGLGVVLGDGAVAEFAGGGLDECEESAGRCSKW